MNVWFDHQQWYGKPQQLEGHVSSLATRSTDYIQHWWRISLTENQLFTAVVWPPSIRQKIQMSGFLSIPSYIWFKYQRTPSQFNAINRASECTVWSSKVISTASEPWTPRCRTCSTLNCLNIVPVTNKVERKPIIYRSVFSDFTMENKLPNTWTFSDSLLTLLEIRFWFWCDSIHCFFWLWVWVK